MTEPLDGLGGVRESGSNNEGDVTRVSEVQRWSRSRRNYGLSKAKVSDIKKQTAKVQVRR